MKIFLAVFLFFTAAFVYSQTLEGLVGSDTAARLREKEIVTNVHFRNISLNLQPQFTELESLIVNTRNNLGPNVAVEALSIYRKGQGVGYWTEEQRTSLFNQLVSLSTLTGIEYFSASRGVMRILYDLSYVIDDPQNKRQIPDPVFDSVPQTLTLYARQRDLTFGDNIYSYEFLTTQNAFFFVQENFTSLTFGIFPAIGRNNLHSVFAVIDAGDYLLIYVVSMARVTLLPGLRDRISNSFTNRAIAVFNWFFDRADLVF